jgi:hypothetical protein
MAGGPAAGGRLPGDVVPEPGQDQAAAGAGGDVGQPVGRQQHVGVREDDRVAGGEERADVPRGTRAAPGHRDDGRPQRVAPGRLGGAVVGPVVHDDDLGGLRDLLGRERVQDGGQAVVHVPHGDDHRQAPASDGRRGRVMPAQAGSGLERGDVVVVGVAAVQRLAEGGGSGSHGHGLQVLITALA